MSSFTHSHGFDPLAEALAIITRLNGNPKSANTLKAGQPIYNEKLTPKLFIQTAEAAGFKSSYVERQLNEIPTSVLPTILQLKNGSTCVLYASKDNEAVIIRPESPMEKETITNKILATEYAGFAFLIKANSTNPSLDNLNTHPAAWFWRTFLAYKSYYSEVALVSIFTNLFAIALPIFVMNVYDRVVPNYAIETLWVLASGIFLIVVFDYIMKTFRVYYTDTASEKIDIIVSRKLFKQMLELDLTKPMAATGTLTHKIQQFENVTSFINSSTILTIFDLPFILLFITIVAYIGGWIVLIPLSVIPLITIITALVIKPLQQAVKNGYTYNSEKQNILVETLKNIDLIKTNVAEGLMLKQWDESSGKAVREGVKSRYHLAVAMNSFSVLNILSIVAVVCVGVYAIQANTLSVGGLIACTLLAGRILAPLAQVLSLLIRYQLAKHSLMTLSQLMSCNTERSTNKHFLHREVLRPEIEFKQVEFRYENQQAPLFRDLSFKIKSGEKVGIIGPMGVGKSTILKLLMGFYQPSSGSIHLSNTDLKYLDPAEFRLKIGYVQQETRLLKGTLRENILLKAPWASDDELINACEAAGAYNFVKSHPKGFDMTISEDGNDLSGGQRQTLILARALLLSPKLILFDEPCNSIDAITEQKFLQNMATYLEDKTLVMITHRATLLPLVSRLIVFNNGKIISDGPRDEVLKSLSASTKSNST